MSVKVSQIRYDGNRRYNNHDLHVYVNDTPLHKIADAWFDDNDIWNLKVKSKAWNMITRSLNKTVGMKLANHFKVPVENCVWSRTTGCSCGCSPGYKIKGVRLELVRRDAWADVHVEPYEIEAFQQYISSDKVKKRLAKDQAEHNAKAQETKFMGTQHAEM